jgi:hypothetical protein
MKKKHNFISIYKIGKKLKLDTKNTQTFRRGMS